MAVQVANHIPWYMCCTHKHVLAVIPLQCWRRVQQRRLAVGRTHALAFCVTVCCQTNGSWYSASSPRSASPRRLPPSSQRSSCHPAGSKNPLHPHSGGRGQALGSVEHVALKRPPSDGQPCRGRVTDPGQPL